MPALKTIRKHCPEALISIDTYLAPVAAKALEAGANWINDVSAGRRDPDLLRVVADAGCPVVLMHSRGNSETMDKLTQYADVVADVKEALIQRSEAAIQAGVDERQIIWDPGLGFAKTYEPTADTGTRTTNSWTTTGTDRPFTQEIHRCGAGRAQTQSSDLGNCCRGMPLRPGGCCRGTGARCGSDQPDATYGSRDLVIQSQFTNANRN